MMHGVRTTVTIDDHLLAEAKLLAVRTHRTIGSVLEDALRKLLEQEQQRPGDFALPRFDYAKPGVHTGVDLEDKEQLAALLGDNDARALP